ncbi:MAG: hypothetical protein B7Z08_07525 [Sphingomonadales bacterium 32-68-7]|nr:MAG: hypothetical protein B7Z08_07525 [Sphingomonadales bacterium 32-68-7]
MALSVVNADLPREHAPLEWAAVQFAQFEHDEKYHREISRLTVQDRLRHMALHFAKYAGRLLEEPADAQFKRIAKAVGGESSNAPREAFAKRLAIAAGRMAGACERLDHLEDFPFRAVILAEVLAILGACLDLFDAEGWNAVAEMEERLAPIKAKSIFHGKF